MRIADVVRRLRRLKNPESVDYVGGSRMINFWKEHSDVTHFFGAHTIDNGGIHMAARRAGATGMRALQIFTAIPKYYGDKSSIKPERVERFRAALAEAKIDPRYVMAHAAYVLNTATPDEEKSRARAPDSRRSSSGRRRWASARSAFIPARRPTTIAKRRPSASRRRSSTRWRRCRAARRACSSRTPRARGARSRRRAAEVGAILRHVPTALRARTGYGLDTCHLFASGYDLREPGAVARVLDEFEEATGEPPGFFHLNDSEGALGSNKDRHMLIGDGQIGVEPFRAAAWPTGARRTFRSFSRRRS